jgi:transcriptional regulator with XRE-family HTH domain
MMDGRQGQNGLKSFRRTLNAKLGVLPTTPPVYTRRPILIAKENQRFPARRPSSGRLPLSQRKDKDKLDIAQIVRRNLKRLRAGRGLSLEALASLSGVSRGMLSQIELGRSVPTISLLWKVAYALQVQFTELTSDRAPAGTTVFPAEEAKMLVSPEGSFTSRVVFPYSPERRVEFYKIILQPRAIEVSLPHLPGSIENLIVAEGKVTMTVGRKSYKLKVDDAILFEADVPHKYVNPGRKIAVIYGILTYDEANGPS